MQNTLGCFGLLGLMLLMSACASLDFDQPRATSFALQDTSDTPLAKHIQPYAAQHPQQSGFAMLNDGIDALAARILLIESATRSIDAQYYFVLNDVTGRLFVKKLLDAADRGVRVRLLMDDIATQGHDIGMAALASHPNFEIRLFNPFSLRTGRYLNVRDYARVNRRMHNKSLIADNQGIIVGGRNIGDEYFSARKDVNFADMDVYGAGPVARDGSVVFDEFWNDRHTLPVAQVVAPLDDPQQSLQELRNLLDNAIQETHQSQYADALVRSALDTLGLGPQSLDWVPYRLVSDPPSKAWNDKEDKNKIVTPIAEVILNAHSELILISPYFVPRKTGIAAFQKLRDNGVSVRVLTNSLASNDVAAVHGGYAPARKPLLRMGVRLYEVRPDAKVKGAKRGGVAGSRASLHTKGFIVDRHKVFFGSFNFDPRSAHINTEMGVFMDAPKIATELSDELIRAVNRGNSTYEVVLNKDNQLRWLDQHGGTITELTREPQTGFWKRFVAGFLRFMPIRGQL